MSILAINPVISVPSASPPPGQEIIAGQALGYFAAFSLTNCGGDAAPELSDV